MSNYNLSKKILPPILEYSYPSVGKEEASYEILAKLSLFSSFADISAVHLRATSLLTNTNGFDLNYTNPSFGHFENREFVLKEDKIKSVNQNHENAISITFPIKDLFKTGDSPKNYKIQIRLKDKDGHFSGWSNAAILRVNLGLEVRINEIEAIAQKQSVAVTSLIPLDRKVVEWTGYYSDNNNSEEYVTEYDFSLLAANKSVIETSGTLTLNDYEIPVYSYKFHSGNFENNKVYFLLFHIKTNFGGEKTATYQIQTRYAFQRAFDVFDVEPNSELGYNLVHIDATEQFVLYNGQKNEYPIKQPKFARDKTIKTIAQNWGAAEEITTTHLQVDKGDKLTAEKDKFHTDDGAELAIILATSNLSGEFPSNALSAVSEENCILRVNNRISPESLRYRVGIFKNQNKKFLVLKEEKYGIINWAIEPFPTGDVKTTQILIEIFKSATGELSFNLKKMFDNIWEAENL
jgi:hypothetical protein|nr:MAG TPA: hypothetical protein [Caudoviricetes sp.]